MKTIIILIILTLYFNISNGQIVNIPDANFKNALIDEGVDTNNDGEIQVSEAEAVISLNVWFKNISSMEGIQSFINIETLICSNNQIAFLDLSQNLNLVNLYCHNNLLSELDVLQNSELKVLWVAENLLSDIDLQQTLQLESFIGDGNFFTSLDLSENSNLLDFSCTDCELENLRIDNGNNHHVNDMFTTGNPDLVCIQVDIENANYPECTTGLPITGWCIDSWTSYSEDCSLGLNAEPLDYYGIYPNPVNEVLQIISPNRKGNLNIKIYNTVGKLLSNQTLDFNKQSSIDVSNLSSGIYFLNIEDESGNTTIKKLVKE